MRKPRGLSSNKPSVHIDKDRGYEPIVLQRRASLRADAIQCNALIERINSSCGVSNASVPARMQVSRAFSGANRGIGASEDTTQGDRPARSSMQPQETYSTLYHVGGYLMAASIFFCAVFIFAIKAKAQELRPGDLTPGPVHCIGAQKHINNVLKKTGMFKDAFALSGEGARQVSQNIFNHIPAADHIIVIRQIDGGSIMVPCVWGKNGPEWAGEQSNRVEVDFKFKRDLEQPQTVLEQPIEEPKKKRTRRAEKK